MLWGKSATLRVEGRRGGGYYWERRRGGNARAGQCSEECSRPAGKARC